MNSRKKYFLSTMLLVLLLLFITIGYAYLSASLNINGTSSINNSTWDIHFENIVVSSGSVSADTPVIDTDRTTVTYEVTLNKPGDFYEFTVDAKNDGSIDAMIDTVVSKLNNTVITNLPNYLTYNVSYSDNTPILSKQELLSGEKETYKVRLEYKKDIQVSDLPDTPQTLNLNFTVTYTQKDSTAVSVLHTVSFAIDSWETIIGAVRSGITPNYYVGDTREIDMGSLGVHTLRIANMSTPSECNDLQNFGQSACGFVIEFADIISKHKMTSGGYTYQDGLMDVYLNNDVYNTFPDALKEGILDTTVYYGKYINSFSVDYHDKLYLLSLKEIFNYTDSDSTASRTRQLDYYSNMGTDTNNFSPAIKKYNGTNSFWWTRVAYLLGHSDNFVHVKSDGNFRETETQLSYSEPGWEYGVSPAFRIG